MRKTMSFALAALLAAAVAGNWAMSRSTTAQSETSNASLLDPIDMMKKVKDLPVHNILDAI